jgi:hypothetical protein
LKEQSRSSGTLPKCSEREKVNKANKQQIDLALAEEDQITELQKLAENMAASRHTSQGIARRNLLALTMSATSSRKTHLHSVEKRSAGGATMAQMLRLSA